MRQKVVDTHLKCDECGNLSQIWRKHRSQKKVGHIKHMWCPACKDTQAHIELRDEAFYPEWIKQRAYQ